MKKATVAKVTYQKEFTSKHGTMYSWHVTMDNGDAGECSTKTNAAPWQQGDEAEYEVTQQEYNDKTYTKIKKAFQQGAPGARAGGSWKPNPESENRAERWIKQRLIIRQAVLNTAASLISSGSGSATLENIQAIAEQLEGWVWRGMEDKLRKAIVPAAPPPDPKPTVTNDPQAEYSKPVATSPQGEEDLPF